MRPLVTVFIPSYNYGRFLPGCVESILTQSNVDVRALIIDDHSSDDTPTIAARLAAGDARIEYRRHSKNWGHIATYNEGIEWAFGDYTMLLSADDLLTDGSLERATRAMEASPTTSFAYGGVIVWDDSEGPPPRVEQSGSVPFRVEPGIDWIEFVCRSGHNQMRAPEVLVRTSAQKEAGGYRADLPHTADLEMWLRLAARGDVCILDSAQAYYRVHGENMHREAKSTDFDIEQRYLAFDAFYEENAGIIANVAGLRALSTKAIKADAIAYHLDSQESFGSRLRQLLLEIRSDPKQALAIGKIPGYLVRVLVGGDRYYELRSVFVQMAGAVKRRLSG